MASVISVSISPWLNTGWKIIYSLLGAFWLAILIRQMFPEVLHRWKTRPGRLTISYIIFLPPKNQHNWTDIKISESRQRCGIIAPMEGFVRQPWRHCRRWRFKPHTGGLVNRPRPAASLIRSHTDIRRIALHSLEFLFDSHSHSLPLGPYFYLSTQTHLIVAPKSIPQETHRLNPNGIQQLNNNALIYGKTHSTIHD